MAFKFLNLKLGAVVLSLFFFFLTSFLAFGLLEKFNSPDETASYFFAKTFAQSGKLTVEEKLNLEAPIVHPRSVNVRADQLVPGSFIGLIVLYGSLAKILGSASIGYLTPFFATLALLAFYFLVKKIFDKKVAVISAIIWSFHPAILYYTARGLLPNMLFVSFSILAAYFAVRINKKILAAALAGVSLAIAIAVRSNEVVWLGPLVFLGILLNYKKISWKPLVTFLFFLILTLTPVAYFHNQTFGSIWRTGYQQLDRIGDSSLGQNLVFDVNVLEPKKNSKSQWQRFKTAIKPFVLPFGLNAGLSYRNAYDYLINIFWWLSIPLIYILVWYLKKSGQVRGGLKSTSRKENSNQKIFIISGLLISLWLIVYYGGTSFRDSTLKGPTIGTSYIRYWLPIYIWSIPLIAKAILHFGRFFGSVVLITLAVLGLGMTFWFTPESLAQVKKKIEQYKVINERVLSLTEEDSIIVTYRTDKIFFPDRRVIHYLPPDYSFSGGIYRLMKKAPIYFFTILPPKDVDYLNASYFFPVGWKLIPYKKLDNFALYRVVEAKDL